MSVIAEVNSLKNDLLKVCEKIVDLQKQGIRIEFQLTEGQLTRFAALQEMKLSS
jgi:septum formation topological specificity factor MinE